jgi:hypothetical protein
VFGVFERSVESGRHEKKVAIYADDYWQSKIYALRIAVKVLVDLEGSEATNTTPDTRKKRRNRLPKDVG